MLQHGIKNTLVTLKQRKTEKGFTLIELLIVIAIIGVLAGTVIVSLGSQTDKAQTASAKSGVSALRTSATVAAVEGGYGANGVCDDIYEKVSGEKTGWEWTASRVCDMGDLIEQNGLTQSGNAKRATSSGTNAKAGEICCHSDEDKWVVWSALPSTDGVTPSSSLTTNTENDIYCADSNGFLGELPAKTGGASRSPNTQGNNAKCK